MQTENPLTTKGGKTFACPLCIEVIIGRDPKQHLQRCKSLPQVSIEIRERLASYYRFNQFVVREDRLQLVDDLMTKEDAILLRFLVLYLGGVLLTSIDWKPISMVDVFKHFQVELRMLF